MKSLRLTAALVALGCCSALSFADVAPPDGGVTLKNGARSTAITTLTQGIPFFRCAGATDPNVIAECDVFSLIPSLQPQEVFGGINETGQAWNKLSLTLTGLTPSDGTVGCGPNSFFSIENCPQTIPANGIVTITFMQGTGTGIGCINPLLPHNDPTNVACRKNSELAMDSNTEHGTDLPYYLGPQQLTGPCKPPEEDEDSLPPGRVCGPDEFVIGVGIAGSHFNPDFLPASGSLIANNAPEPPTLVLFGSGMLTLLLFGIKKARLA